VGRGAVEGSELLERLQLLGRAFRPAAPIDRRDLFAGRTEQLAEVFAAVAQPGQHAVIYGERGVGKTSLATVAAETLRSSNMLSARATCDSSDDFASIWQKALDEIVMRRPKAGVGFASATVEDVESAGQMLGSGPVTPHTVRKAMHRVTQKRELAVFVDEFDRLRDPEARTLFADTVKILSDQLVGATVVLVGVADDVSELIREHGSIERAVVQIHMPRMSRAELEEIVTKGVAAAKMTITKRPTERIAHLSQGLPHYTHLLAQLAAQSALDARRTEVRLADVEVAVRRAIAKAQQTISDAYQEAVSGTRSTLYPDVLLACALAESDEYGSFAPADVRAPLTAVAGKPYDTRAFAKHLETLADDDRGPVLQKRGAARTARFRFANPLLQPYVVLRGVSEGRVSPTSLR
jgi:DNA transposition AAA+ family ATPase